MSITLDKLHALKREAGGVVQARTAFVAGPSPRAGADAAAATPDVPPPHPAANDASIDQASVHATPSPAFSAVPRVADPAALHGAPPRGPATPPSVAPPPSATQVSALRRLLGLRERPLAPALPRRPVERHLPGAEIAPGLHYVEAFVPADSPRVALPLAFARRDTHVDPRHLLFFDTETTGLAGGTGTRAFMIGAADWQGDGLRIRQLLIANLAAEAAMLREFATWLSPHTVLASYNGRSYDAPLLKTRYRLARLPDPLHALDHVDLLHPTRRRYRGRWENCRLATIERELLRIVREDDLPGAQAPAAWLGFLRGGSSALLHRVLAHNHQDVVTLAGLMLRLVEAEAVERAARP